jgi:HD-like signal output (HDOD) protein
MLHDIGLVALQRWAATEPDFAQRLSETGQSPHDAEEAVLGFDHGYLGGLICERWGLDRTMALAVSSHHCPSSDLASRLSCVVHVANALLRSVETNGGAILSFEADPAVLSWLGLAQADIESLIPEFQEHLRDSEDLVLAFSTGWESFKQ